ncbi:MAG: TldD/PmbA family protein [Candidatus Marinimicrobia bacterium]|nr:TldD/PmbA family protein [Candidatus Neomarinimicrobiota bacterium]MBL7022569.1 TldD/PmbA family protein [Candidatus Neomarinimicrobiota bacterium]MBL7108925.1 TldD/PmbA family protein [Candidatus Neomarinimicrobiota bacterium]
MKKLFNKISDALLNQISKDEHLKISFSGENSQFIRFSKSKIRQTGLVDEVSISLELIHQNKTCSGGITVTSDEKSDIANVQQELQRLRKEVVHLPEDPYIVLPEDTGSSEEEHKGNLLPIEDAVNALTPAMQGVDLSGIWASGKIFIGNANSAGQKHWFSTETFSLDYSLITSDEKMVKTTFAGSEWNQKDYETTMADSIKKLRMMEQPAKKLKPGNYRTYIAPAGVADILGMFSWNGISEASIQQGQSAFGKMRNENAKLSPLFGLSEDFRKGLVPRFNGNGEIAPEQLSLIENCNLENTLVSTRTAKEYEKKSNNAGEGESLRSPIMKTGTLDKKDIFQKLDTGIYLSNLHYLNWSDNIGGRITGMTRYACFWVENGEIVAPIETMRFDDSLYNFFGENLEEVDNVAKLNLDVETYEGRALGGVVCPGILLKSFSLTL